MFLFLIILFTKFYLKTCRNEITLFIWFDGWNIEDKKKLLKKRVVCFEENNYHFLRYATLAGIFFSYYVERRYIQHSAFVMKKLLQSIYTAKHCGSVRLISGKKQLRIILRIKIIRIRIQGVHNHFSGRCMFMVNKSKQNISQSFPAIDHLFSNIFPGFQCFFQKIPFKFFFTKLYFHSQKFKRKVLMIFHIDKRGPP